MAAITTSAALCSIVAAPVQKQYEGLRATSVKCHMLPVVKSRSRVTCSYIGSPTNLIMVGAITAQLLAGRFGLAPAANRKATAGLKLVDRETGQETGDPASFTATDTLAHGAVGHVLGVGIVLGLKNLGII